MCAKRESENFSIIAMAMVLQKIFEYIGGVQSPLPGGWCESDSVDPVPDLLDVEGPPDGLVVEDDVNGHLAPARLKIMSL